MKLLKPHGKWNFATIEIYTFFLHKICILQELCPSLICDHLHDVIIICLELADLWTERLSVVKYSSHLHKYPFPQLKVLPPLCSWFSTSQTHILSCCLGPLAPSSILLSLLSLSPCCLLSIFDLSSSHFLEPLCTMELLMEHAHNAQDKINQHMWGEGPGISIVFKIPRWS